MKLAAMPSAERPETSKPDVAQPDVLRHVAKKPTFAWSVVERKEQPVAEDPEDMWDNLPV